jgi:hypothetical protein
MLYHLNIRLDTRYQTDIIFLGEAKINSIKDCSPLLPPSNTDNIIIFKTLALLYRETSRVEMAWRLGPEHY